MGAERATVSAMEVPSGLPEHLQSPLDAAIHEAEAEFLIGKNSGAAFMNKWQRWVLLYVKTIFFAYADQACQAGTERLWTGEEIREKMAAYLKSVAHATYFEKVPDEARSHSSLMIDDSIAGLVRAVKVLPGWATLQAKLAEVARARHGNPASAETSRDINGVRRQSPPRSGMGACIDQLREECRLSEQELAERVGLDPTTVSRHITEKMRPSLRAIRNYELEFNKVLKRKVFLSETPNKRQ